MAIVVRLRFSVRSLGYALFCFSEDNFMKWRFTEQTNERKVFKQSYILACIFGIFALSAGFTVRYIDNKSLSSAKWKGLLIGTLINTAVLVATYFLCRIILPVGISIFIAHIIHIILFGILYKTHL